MEQKKFASLPVAYAYREDLEVVTFVLSNVSGAKLLDILLPVVLKSFATSAAKATLLKNGHQGEM